MRRHWLEKELVEGRFTAEGSREMADSLRHAYPAMVFEIRPRT